MTTFDPRSACLFRTTAVYEILRGAGWSGADPGQVAQAKDLAETGFLSFDACGCRDWLVIRGSAYDAGRRLAAGAAPMFVCPTSCAYTPSDPYAPDGSLPEARKPYVPTGSFPSYGYTCPLAPPPPTSFWTPLLVGAGVVAAALALRTAYKKNPENNPVSSRRLEERTYYPGADLYDEWEPAHENALYETRHLKDAELTRWVREANARNKREGNNTRYRTVEKEDSFLRAAHVAARARRARGGRPFEARQIEERLARPGGERLGAVGLLAFGAVERFQVRARSSFRRAACRMRGRGRLVASVASVGRDGYGNGQGAARAADERAAGEEKERQDPNFHATLL